MRASKPQLFCILSTGSHPLVRFADLRNLRAAAGYLERTELKFDLTSAVEELQRQIGLEFDFLREARVMVSTGHNLKVEPLIVFRAPPSA